MTDSTGYSTHAASCSFRDTPQLSRLRSATTVWAQRRPPRTRGSMPPVCLYRRTPFMISSLDLIRVMMLIMMGPDHHHHPRHDQSLYTTSMALPSDNLHDKLCPFERSVDADYESLLHICPSRHSGTPRHPHGLVILVVLRLRTASHVEYMKY